VAANKPSAKLQGGGSSHPTVKMTGGEKSMRRLIIAALTSACLVSFPVLLWAAPNALGEEVIPGFGTIQTKGGKVYCHLEKPALCTPDELKQIEAHRKAAADAKAKVATCIKACSDAAKKCFDAEKAANLRPSEVKKDAPNCGLIATQCDQRC